MKVQTLWVAMVALLLNVGKWVASLAYLVRPRPFKPSQRADAEGASIASHDAVTRTSGRFAFLPGCPLDLEAQACDL
jgi:hypothetical protein